jgi:hypothetical protein
MSKQTFCKKKLTTAVGQQKEKDLLNKSNNQVN